MQPNQETGEGGWNRLTKQGGQARYPRQISEEANFLFARSDSGGGRAAAIYTIVRIAKLNGLNPETYLRDVLTKIAEGPTINKIDEPLPWNVIQQA